VAVKIGLSVLPSVYEVTRPSTSILNVQDVGMEFRDDFIASLIPVYL
jgi:hypothetical protein